MEKQLNQQERIYHGNDIVLMIWWGTKQGGEVNVTIYEVIQRVKLSDLRN